MQSYARSGPLMEFLILATSLVVAYLASSTLDAFEIIHYLIHRYEWLDIDELVVAIVALLFVHSILSWRRWKELERRVEERTLELRQEIEQRKRAEEVARERQHCLEITLNNIPDFVWMKDKEGRYTLSNKAHAEISGFAEHEIIGP